MVSVINDKPQATKFTAIRKTFGVVLLISITFVAGYYFGVKGYSAQVRRFPEVTISRESPEELETLDFSLFWRVWDTLEDRYYDKDKLIQSKMVYGAIKGMVSAIEDPYTVFLPPTENKVVQEDLQGNFEGVGIQIGFQGSQLAVIAPLPDSPAENAGVEAGDLIIGIKDTIKDLDRGTQGITLSEAVEAIRGTRGSKVTLTLLRGEETDPRVVELTRESISVPSISLEYVGEGSSIAHVRVLKFGGETKAEWDTKVVELLTKPGLTGIVLDVRNNPGGYLQGAVDLATDFLEVGDLVVVEEDGRGGRIEDKVETLGRLRNQKVVVLINKGSASASEILAGALRDGKNIKLVGENSFGKGTIQEPQQINGGSGLHITIAKWLTPSGYWVDGQGLDPDVVVEDNSETDEDEQLQEAIKLVTQS